MDVLGKIMAGPTYHQLQEQLDTFAAANTELDAENRALRRLLFLTHTGPDCSFGSLYGDDGEMACNSCMLDFKRMSPQQIEEIIQQRNLAALKKEQAC